MKFKLRMLKGFVVAACVGVVTVNAPNFSKVTQSEVMQRAIAHDPPHDRPIAGSAESLVSQSLIARSEEEEIAAIAKEVTVVIHGQNPGSGVIIGKQGNVYTVLTAKHVVATPDPYEIATSDAMTHVLDYNTVTKLPDVDLAVAQFRSDRAYPVAILGNSNRINEGGEIYISGWPHPGQAITSRIFQITSGTLSGRALGAAEDGYELVYTNVTRSGMSGGPVFDSNGTLIAIHGRAEGEIMYNPDTGNTLAVKSGFNLGIPIDTYLDLAPQVGINLPYAHLYFSSANNLQVDVGLSGAAIAPNRTLIGGYQDGSIRLWNLTSGTVTKTLAGHDRGFVSSLAVSADGQILATAANGHLLRRWQNPIDVRLWDLPTGELKKTLSGYGVMALSPDGNLLATAHNDKEVVELFDPRTGESQGTLDIDEPVSLTFSPDSQTLVSAQRVVKIWDLSQGRKARYLEDLPRVNSSAICVAIGPDSRTLATVSLNGEVKLWDLQTGKLLSEVDRVSKHTCKSLSFGPYGNTLVSSSFNPPSVYFWNLQNGDRFTLPNGEHFAVFSPDGRAIVTGGGGKGFGSTTDRLIVWRAGS